jgi:hypothetical protein
VVAPEVGPRVLPDAERRPRAARSGAALHAWAERLIAAELARCEACMTPEQWIEHHAWIEENARASLLAALRERAQRGTL